MTFYLSDRLAVIAGKVSARAIRAVGAGLGSNLPGRVSRALSSTVLTNLARQARSGILCVSGTNGKSTTAGLLSAILAAASMKVAHNRQGANLVPGITASLVDAAAWNGDMNVDWCLFETDEAALPLVAAEVPIAAVVVTNLFRDQLDRFGELDTTASLIKKGIAINDSLAVLNADDPNVAQLAPATRTVYYGINSLDKDPEVGCSDQEPVFSSVTELSYCPDCGAEFQFEKRFYGQLGHYTCPQCHHRRPPAHVSADNVAVDVSGSTFTLHHKESSTKVRIALPGLFNVYNAVAAAALALAVGLDLEQIRQGLEHYSTLFGRSERITLKGKPVLIQLIKNPAGASEAVRAAVNDPQARLMIAINDNYADGRDVSWLWDADFDLVAAHGKPIFVSGCRAADMAVRLKYGGVDSARIKVNPVLEASLNDALAAVAPGETLWLLPTYTCLLQLQKVARAMGTPLAKT
jgi:UDP-N-acetylmuramyl tripeptide synthase